jgi:predicted RNase H-like HicB family nuclease
MLVQYIQAAMRRAKYEILPEDKSYYGEIPDCRGVWANESTLEACRDELQSVLEDWLMIKLRHGDSDLPIIDGVDLSPKPAQEVA